MLTRNKLKLYVAIFFSVVIWGTSFSVIKLALRDFSPFQITCWRIFFASITYLLSFPLLGLKIPAKQDIFIFIAISLLGIIGYHFILNLGEQRSAANMAGFIVNLSPLFTITIAVIFLREKISLNIILGAIISLIGVWLMNFSFYKKMIFDLGTIFLLLAAFLWSLFFVFQKILTKKYKPTEIICYSIWMSCLVILYFCIKEFPQLFNRPRSSVFSLIYLGVFPTAIAYILWSYVLSQMPVSNASVYTYMVPLISSLFSFLILDEKPNIIFLIGGSFILSGIILIKVKKAKS